MLERLRARFRRRRDPAEQRCEGCGGALRVEGTGRHRIYRYEGEPVLGDSCPGCGAPLPGKAAARPA
jgi:ribosomal protein L34E